MGVESIRKYLSKNENFNMVKREMAVSLLAEIDRLKEEVKTLRLLQELPEGIIRNEGIATTKYNLSLAVEGTPCDIRMMYDVILIPKKQY